MLECTRIIQDHCIYPESESITVIEIDTVKYSEMFLEEKSFCADGPHFPACSV